MKEKSDEGFCPTWQNAEYKKQNICEYVGNPLIEALPPMIETADDVIDALYEVPVFSAEDKKLSTDSTIK